MSYTSDEVQTIVSSLVRSSVRRPVNSFGARQHDITFEDTLEIAAATFVLLPASPYYLIYLACQSIKEQANNYNTAALALIEAVRTLKRHVTPVNGTSDLSNARTALLDLENGVYNKAAQKRIDKLPAFVRYTSNLNKFLAKSRSNIVEDGALVSTPDEARAAIPSLVAAYKQAYFLLLTNTFVILRAEADFQSLDLAKLVARTVVTNSRMLLDARIDLMSNQSAEENMRDLRQTVLETLSVKSAVKTFGTYTPYSEYITVPGSGTSVGTSTFPAISGAFSASIPGPYALTYESNPALSTALLRIYLDGAPPYPAPPTLTAYLPSSVVCTVDGQTKEPFVLTGGNNVIVFDSDGTVATCTLTTGTRTSDQVCADMNVSLAALGLYATPYFLPLFFDGVVNVTFGTGPIFSLASGSFPTSLVAGQLVEVYGGDPSNIGAVRTITSVSGGVIYCSGAALTSASDQYIRVGGASRCVRVTALNKSSAVVSKKSIKVTPSTDVHKSCGITLGIFGEQSSTSAPVSVPQIVEALNLSSNRCKASVADAPLIPAVLIRTNPANPFTLVVYYFRSTTTSQTTGLTPTFSFASVSGVSVGDYLVVRDGPDSGLRFEVTAVTSTTVSCTAFASPITATAPALIEVGPPSPASLALLPGFTIIVDSGPNAGRYTIESATLFDVTVTSGVPQWKTSSNEPYFSTGSVVMDSLVVASSAVTTTATAVVHDPLNIYSTVVFPTSSATESLYFQVPQLPKEVQVGDHVDFYDGPDVSSPTRSRTILSISGTTLSFSSPIPVGVWSFREDIAPPYARFRSARVADYTLL